jgi:hypothetical protein
MLLKPEKGIGYCVGTKYNNSKKGHFKKYNSKVTFIINKNVTLLL